MDLTRLSTLILVIGLIPTTALADLEVGFVLDTTGSMGSEIREAKDRILDLAKDLAKARPNEALRLGVVAFRDQGDDYVTQISLLSSDVAITKAFLDTLTADGGGDTPEHVLAGLDAALEGLGFSGDASTEKQIFLIGDAPPHLDYQGGATINSVIDKARARNISIHSIGCRSLDPAGIDAFQRLAYSTEGRYQHIGGIRGESASLARAVREMSGAGAPVLQPIASNMERIETDRSRGERFEAELQQLEGRCVIDLHVPEGLALMAPPTVAWVEDHLETTVQLSPGRGETVRLTLAACPKPLSHKVEITIGGQS